MAGESQAEVQASWGVIGMLSAAQFVMVLDTTVMNVSISQVVEDLGTTVVGLQGAITMYTLVMAAFMLLGGKLGDRWGAKRAYAVGLLVYGAGSLTTALAPNLATLLVGWSFVEGIGAILVIPAIAALIASTYRGRQRAIAYGILGGVAGASAAAGPLIGGWVSAYFSWRYVFAAETVVVLALMLFLRLIPDTVGRGAKLDLGGAALSALGLGCAVFGVLMSSQWGWVLPTESVPVVAGAPLTPLGLSPTFWLLVTGGAILTWFVRHEEAVKERGDEPLVDLGLLRIPVLRAGLGALFCQQFIVLATFFVLPLYLQTVLGFDSLETGITILPLSLSLFVCALAGSALTARLSPRRIVETGLAFMLIGEAALMQFIDADLRNIGFSIALAFVGGGLGLLASQLGNIIMSSVPAARTGEAGGLQGTAQNLGASMGTALIGSVLIAVLASSFQSTVLADPALPDDLKQAIVTTAEKNANFVTTSQVEQAALAAGVSAPETRRIVSAYAASQLDALRASLAFVAVFALVTLVWVRRLPHLALPAPDAGG